jgi:hypothetical protein
MYRTILCAAAGAVIFAMPASAQSLREQVVGAWALVSCPNPSFPPCAGNNGIFIVDASGHYAWMEAGRGRPKVAVPAGTIVGADRNATTPEEYKAMASGFLGQFGTWSLNEATKMMTLHADGGLFPNVEGTDFATFPVSISGDEMKVGTSPQGVWRRISK